MAAQAARDLAKLNLDYTKVTAPFDGRIGRQLVDPGNLVGSGGIYPPGRFNQIDPLYVYFTINETGSAAGDGQDRAIPGSRPKNLKIPLTLGLANETGYPHQGLL